MWKIKRFLILLFGMLLCVSGFGVYTLLLGAIDGLPPLESKFLPSERLGGEEPPPPAGEADKRLEKAFGAVCKELQRPLRLWLPDKQVALAFGDFKIDSNDGRVRLAPFSAAIFHKSKVPGAYPEISTITCDVAILTMDKPVTQYSELNGKKVIAVEMVGQRIEITNNRRTIEKNDDIDVLITNGPLFWEERQDKIWTAGVVCLTDHQAKPPTVIRGKGMEMFLAKDSGPYHKSTKPASASNDTGNVEKIKLLSDVQMHFWTDSSSGFLGGTPNKKKPVQSSAALAEAKPAPKEKAHIDIRTRGPFLYDLTKETAWFESDVKSAKEAESPDQVHVQRWQKIDGGDIWDLLTCDRLDLQFRKRLEPAAPNAVDATEGKEIETALATRRDENEVVLAINTEGMEAHGSEMFYRAGDAANGPMTILKGEPGKQLRTVRNGHSMRCQELQLFAANRYGEGQRAWARGPGQIDLLDSKNPKKNTFPTHVIWRDILTIVKEKEGAQAFDLMTVTGEASFIDDIQHQQLHGEKISVWMKTKESENQPEASGDGRQELHRVVSQDRVRAYSPEFIVRKANLLTMIFLPETSSNDRLPDPGVTGDKETRKQGDKETAKQGATMSQSPPKSQPTQQTQAKPKPPIELEGDEITATISTLGTKKELQELIAKRNVYVFQAGEKTGEKSIDITGALLTVKHFEKGDTMVVYGEKDKLARVEVGDSIIWGPRVSVDQAANWADVEGAGTMEMPSNKTVDGAHTAKPGSRIVILWKKNMTFDGKIAVYRGDVQASEKGGYSRLLCKELTAILDKYVSFKEGQKDKDSAKIDRLVCDKNVYVDDSKVIDVHGKKELERRTILQGTTLINYDGGRAHLKGFGEVRTLAQGSADQNMMAPANPNKAAAQSVWKLTHVKFRDAMHTTTGDDFKKAVFYGSNEGVEVCHFPTIYITAKMDPDHPPKDGLYLRCNILEVEAKQIGDRTSQTMVGKGSVTFKTDLYYGRADTLKYDEKEDKLILEGSVNFYRIETGHAEAVNAQKVLYNRKTGKVDIDGIKSITN